MNPALEYLIHSDLIKEWFSTPCSIFLQKKETGDKLVVTIGNEFKPSESYSIKHWNIANCDCTQALPSMLAYSVPKKEIFSHLHVIIPGYRLIRYEQESIRSHHNSFRSPMSVELYSYFFDNSLHSHRHLQKRLNWLWARFIRIYLPSLAATTYSVYRSEAEIAENQREIVSNFMKKEWQYWKKWQQYMLLSPAEVMFYKEYSKE